MIFKNKDTIERTIVRLQSMLETDESIDDVDRWEIGDAINHLKNVTGQNLEIEEDDEVWEESAYD